MRGAKGNYLTLYSGILFAAIRGLEMPLVALNFQRVLVAFEFAKVQTYSMERLNFYAVILADLLWSRCLLLSPVS